MGAASHAPYVTARGELFGHELSSRDGAFVRSSAKPAFAADTRSVNARTPENFCSENFCSQNLCSETIES